MVKPESLTRPKERSQKLRKLFKTSGVRFGELLKVIADKGYQGISKIHRLSETPIKKSRGKKLTKEQKQYNRELSVGHRHQAADIPQVFPSNQCCVMHTFDPFDGTKSHTINVHF